MFSSNQTQSLEEQLAQKTAAGELIESLPNGAIRCLACGHRCKIPEGRPGVCKVRFNQGGALRVPFGYVAGMQCDPIEKKPFYHVLPGSNAFSFGMLGCDYHCAYCQNWITSQTLRDKNAGSRFRECSALELADAALRMGARTVTSTYNEPLITSEWAVAVFREAKTHGLYTSYVSNGNGTQEVIEYIKPWTDFYKVDLKSFQDKHYRKLGGTLDAVLQTIQRLKENRFWVEIVTLVVPSWNDSESELRDIARFLASVHPEIPWHVTAFHEDYKMSGMGRTQAKTLQRAAEIGKEEGLQYVYAGNLPGQLGDWENTYCHHCGELLVERLGFHIIQNRINGTCCPSCKQTIPGVWA